MKKYILFLFYQYYPQGGMNDVHDSYDTIEEAVDVFRKSIVEHGQIVDRDTWVVVESLSDWEF